MGRAPRPSLPPDAMLAVALALAGATAALYFMRFHGGLSGDPQRWSHFGDYVGGIVGPIVALFALWAVIHAVKLQQKELESTRQELRQSREAFQQQVAHFQLETEILDLRAAVAHLESQIDACLGLTKSIPIRFIQPEPVSIADAVAGVHLHLGNRPAMVELRDAGGFDDLQRWMFEQAGRLHVLFGFLARLLYQLEVERGQGRYALAIKLKYNATIRRLHELDYLQDDIPRYLMQLERLPDVVVQKDVPLSYY